MNAEALLDEFAGLCRGEGYGNADFLNGMTKKERTRMDELRAEILEIMLDSRQACTFMRCPGE